MDTAVWEKIIIYDNTTQTGLPNIAAVKITGDTIKYIENSFSAMSMP